MEAEKFDMRQRKTTKTSETTPLTPAAAARRLHYFHELDPWQQDNHFIRSGYVKEHGTFRDCWKLLFYIHNETGNIYLHLIPGSLAFWAVALYLRFGLHHYANFDGWWEYANFLMFAAACWGCLFMSLTFHCIKSHSHRVQRFGNQLDYFGIVILITCSLILIMNFSYHDEPRLRWLFNAIFLVLGTACTVTTLHPKFSTSEYRPIRLAMFILFGLSGVLPVAAGIVQFGPDVTWDRAQMKWLVLEGAFYIGGALLYAMRVPERFTHRHQTEEQLATLPSAGKFDIWGHSHQIFHVMVVIAAYCHWRALLGCYHYMHQHLM